MILSLDKTYVFFFVRTLRNIPSRNLPGVHDVSEQRITPIDLFATLVFDILREVYCAENIVKQLLF